MTAPAQRKKSKWWLRNVGKGLSGEIGAGSACLITAPAIHAGPINFGGSCVFSKTEARAVMGVLIITAGGLIVGVGLIVLAAWGVQKTGGLNKAASVASVVPGGKPVATGLRAASSKLGG